jgi:multidrug resistance efflux pump
MKYAFAFVFLVCVATAQDRINSDERQKDDFPRNIKEAIIKKQIEEAKKDFDEMLKRSEEVEKLCEEIYVSYEQNKKLTSEDQKKLERIEKLVKKICDELGVECSSEKEQVSSLEDLFKSLKEEAEELKSILKKTSRFTVSTEAVEISNSIIKKIRIIKGVSFEN